MRKKILKYLLFVVLVVLLWEGWEYLFQTFITHQGYTFSYLHMSTPLAVGIVGGYFVILRNNDSGGTKTK